MADFDLYDHGTIALLTPLSETASEWIDEHIGEDAMRWGLCSIVIEPRDVQNVLDAISAERMTVDGYNAHRRIR